MSFTSPYMHPAKLVSYNQAARTANVSIAGLTDGVSEGIEAMLAYPIGDDDQDTERELLAGADVWVFFEQGDTSMPVIAFYRRHGQGRAAIDVRRIRQANIELLARATITLDATDLVDIKAKNINLTGAVNIEGNITHNGDQNTTGNKTTTGNISTTGNVITAGNQTITGGHTVNGESVSYGNQTINGSISATVDIKAAGVSLNSHKHGGVKSGGSSTSSPQ
jgi:phage baseplate assembly protein gpV